MADTEFIRKRFSGGGYCPPPFVSSTSGIPIVFVNGEIDVVTIDGLNLDQITAINCELTAGGSPSTINILSQSFDEIVFELTPNALGDHTCTLVGFCSDYQFSFDSQNITCLIGGDSTPWQSVQGANVSAGELEIQAGAGNGWNRGGYFGFAPANTETSVTFEIATPLDNSNGNFGFVGVRNSQQTTITFGSAGRALYFRNGNLIPYNNASQQAGSVGNYAVGDEFEIRRNLAGLTEWYKNGILIYTYTTNDTGNWHLAVSAFRATHIIGAKICHS